MRKQMISLIMIVVITVCGFYGLEMSVQAEGTEAIGAAEDLDFYYFTAENSLIVYTYMNTRGVYLAEGDSFVSKLATNKIGAGGSTTAALRCKVSITSVVERYNSGTWVYVISWTQTNENAISAAISKSLAVSGGTYYRVRSTHYAGTDSSTSCTNGLYIGN